MTSLSDRNMSLGDVLLPQGGKQRCLCPRVQGLFTLRKVLLMQLSVALSLHYGWDSQLNTSEMFWIDISRWMISSRYWWISVYLLWRTAHALNLNLSCNVVNIGLRSWSCQLPSCNLFTSHSCFIVFWERDITSDVRYVQNLSIISACSMPLLGDIAMIFIHFHTLLIIFGLTY